MENLNDSDLVQRTGIGDENAFRELVRRYQGQVYGCALGITRRPSDAADAAQEAFIRFHRNLEQYDPRRPLKPYLLTIAANCARTLLVRRRREPQGDGGDALLDQLADPGATPRTRLLRHERNEAVHALIAELPETPREVCSLFYLSGCSCREIAEILRMSETAVKVALHRARKRLLATGARQWRSVT